MPDILMVCGLHPRYLGWGYGVSLPVVFRMMAWSNSIISVYIVSLSDVRVKSK